MLGILHTFYITVVVELTRLFYNEHKTEDNTMLIYILEDDENIREIESYTLQTSG